MPLETETDVSKHHKDFWAEVVIFFDLCWRSQHVECRETKKVQPRRSMTSEIHVHCLLSIARQLSSTDLTLSQYYHLHFLIGKLRLTKK